MVVYMYGEIALKMAAGLVGIVVITRLLGKKEMSQVTPLDFVYAIVLGGIISNGMYLKHITIWETLFALVFWGLIIFIVEASTQKFDKWRSFLKGEPTIIIRKGRVDRRAMKRNMLETEQVRSLLRMQGIFSISEVEYAILENSGSLSVLPKASGQPVEKQEMLDDYPQSGLSYLLIEDGEINKESLKIIQKEKDWLLSEIKKQGHVLENIFFAEWSEQGGFTIQEYEETETSRTDFS